MILKIHKLVDYMLQNSLVKVLEICCQKFKTYAPLNIVLLFCNTVCIIGTKLLIWTPLLNESKAINFCHFACIIYYLLICDIVKLIKHLQIEVNLYFR